MRMILIQRAGIMAGAGGGGPPPPPPPVYDTTFGVADRGLDAWDGWVADATMGIVSNRVRNTGAASSTATATLSTPTVAADQRVEVTVETLNSGVIRPGTRTSSSTNTGMFLHVAPSSGLRFRIEKRVAGVQTTVAEVLGVTLPALPFTVALESVGNVHTGFLNGAVVSGLTFTDASGSPVASGQPGLRMFRGSGSVAGDTEIGTFTVTEL